MVKVYQFTTDADFTIASLASAIQMIERDIGEDSKFTLILGALYEHRDTLEKIFVVRGKLDIPFERSYCLHTDAWILTVDNGSIFYSQGG